MKKTTILLSAALMFFGLTAKAQTTITFDTEDYKAIGVYDKWEESPFRTCKDKDGNIIPAKLEGNAGVALNPSTTPDEVLGVAPNSSEKVVAFQRSRYGSNVYGVRIDLKEPIRVTKQLQYIHVMTYLKDKPTASRMMVIGLGKRLEESWSGQSKDDVEQFWSLTPANVEPKDGWQDIVVSFKGFSYSKEENANSGIDLHSLVIVPDVRTPDEDVADWVAYFDEIVVDNNPNKRFSTEQYALTYDKEAAMTRDDRAINSVGLSVGDKSYSSPGPNKKFYANNTTKSVFSAMAGAEVQPTFSYKGGWMNGYVYVDWGRDALFKDALNDNGTPAEGSDVVSYNAVQIGGETWYKSDGTTVGSGNNIGAGVPKFTVPAGTPAGFYRMRYKVDWNSIDPAGGSTIISDGGGIVDVMLDVHGDKVAVNASQLNGDIYAADGTVLINYAAGYEQPLKVKIVPAPGFVQYGFTLKYGYDVAAKEQLDDKGNPNYIEVKVPYTEVAGDGTYTIPAEYMRGSQVSIIGDMQQVQPYTVEVVGLEGQGGVVYANIETLNGGTVNATQFFSVNQVAAIAVEGYTATVTLNDRVITVTYRLNAVVCDPISSLSELKNYKLYHIKSKNNEGYLAWNASITDTYLSLRGVTNFGSGEPEDADVRAKYAEEVNPFDETVVWQIILEDDEYYLYHPAKKAYVTRDGRDYKFTETKTALDAIRDNGDGSFSFHAGGGYGDGSENFACIVTNEAASAVRNWTWSDHGSVMQIIENPNVYTLEYTVEVVGGVTGGGITLDGTDYLDGATVMATEFLTAADVTAKSVFLSEGEVIVDKENAKISVTYSDPVLNPEKYYTLECKATDGHGKFIKDDGTSINGRSNEGSYFMFEPGTVAGTYYIKSVVSGKYINANGNAVTVDVEKKTAWVLGVPAHTAGVATFEDGDTDKYLNNNEEAAPCLKANHHDGGPGEGNACSLWKLVEYPVSYVVTYSFKYNGEELFTQTATVNKGSEYPDYTVQLPYGVSAAAKPAETVNGNVTYDVTLTAELPFVVAADMQSITTWYYVKMHSNNLKYIQALEGGSIEWNDAEVAEGEENSHLWAFVGSFTDGAWRLKVVNKEEKKAIVSTSGDAALGDAANATAFIVTSSAATTDGFCLKYPEANYLNAQSGFVKSWGDPDAGSTIRLGDSVEESGTTAITNAGAGAEPTIIYDLMGRRVEKMEKGVYIVNAKKVVIK
ncbi:MAG: hypothetical protein IKT86_05815 [Bacteroidaceae bacterium]|nr:hypothetical protein [Bacteroidaceae bacterium]